MILSIIVDVVTAPTFFGWAAILSEFVGGILLAVGLLTRPAAAFSFATLAALVAGPGRFWLDALWASRRSAFRGSASQSLAEAEPRAS